jgi:hypothetical protein
VDFDQVALTEICEIRFPEKFKICFNQNASSNGICWNRYLSSQIVSWFSKSEQIS